MIEYIDSLSRLAIFFLGFDIGAIVIGVTAVCAVRSGLKGRK